MKRKGALVLGIVLGIAVEAMAQDLMEPPPGEEIPYHLKPWAWEEEIEHLRINLPYTLEAEEFEVNLVTEYLSFDNEERKSRDLGQRVELEYGITPSFMVELEYTYLFLDPAEGGSLRRPGDVEFEAKYMAPEFEGWAAALGVAVGSVWTPERGEREPAIEVFLPVSYVISDLFRAHLTVGIEGIRHEGPERFVNAAIEARPLGSDLIVQVGLNVEREGDEGPETSLVPGFLLRFPGTGLKVGAGVALGLSEEAQDWGLLLNLEVELD